MDEYPSLRAALSGAFRDGTLEQELHRLGTDALEWLAARLEETTPRGFEQDVTLTAIRKVLVQRGKPKASTS